MKKIEDYLHYYLGRKVTHNETGDTFTLTANRLAAYLHGDLPMNIKPVLRPLSNMSESEAAKLRKLDKIVSVIPCPHFNNIHRLKHGEQLRLLLKMGFDLFGLIESGLAIAKTKIGETIS